MDEIWERAVETALEGQKDVASVRTLTLDGVVKCVHGRLPSPSLFEKYHNLQHFSIANIGVSSLEQFPRLRNLQKLVLSDNRIAGGLEFLVEAGLVSLRDLDLSNNRIQEINDLRPLAELRLVSLDLYECPVTRVKDYRSQVFGLIRSLKYLDKMDLEENERPESEDEEEDEADDEEDDPGSGEIDGEERPYGSSNGHRVVGEGVVDVDEDEESDADEEETETETPRVVANGVMQGDVQQHRANGFGAGEDEEGNDSDDEIDDEDWEDEDDDSDGDDDVVEVHEIVDSDEDGVEIDEDDEDDEVEEQVDNDDGDLGDPESSGRLVSTEGEIDGHEQGEDEDDEDDIGETGEEDQGIDEVEFEDEDDVEDEEEDTDTGYLVQPVGQVEVDAAGGGSDMDPENEDEDVLAEEDENEDEDGEVQEVQPSSSSSHKRKRDGEDDGGGDDDDDDSSSGGGGDDDSVEEDDVVEK